MYPMLLRLLLSKKISFIVQKKGCRGKEAEKEGRERGKRGELSHLALLLLWLLFYKPLQFDLVAYTNITELFILLSMIKVNSK